jgi:hypothetical protein
VAPGENVTQLLKIELAEAGPKFPLSNARKGAANPAGPAGA